MPIKSENRSLYPANWKSEIVPRIRERDGDRCIFCGVQNGAYGFRMPDGSFLNERGLTIDGFFLHGLAEQPKRIRIVLTCAHLVDMNPANCSDENLGMLCQRCHNRLDMPHRRANAARTRQERKAAGDLFP